MSVFEGGVRGRDAVSARFAASADIGSDRSRAFDRIGRVPAGRSAVHPSGPLAAGLLAFARLVFPVLLLITLAAAALIYGTEPAEWLGAIGIGGKALDTGVLALPVSFFLVQLTNRRYGAGYALAQVVAAAALLAAGAAYAGDDLELLRGSVLPAPRILAAFGTGLLVAQLVAIFVFDRLRGPRWWQAPFFSTLLGSAALCVVAYPSAYMDTGVQWGAPMLAYLGILAAMSVLLVVPYWLLRAVIAPLPGYGGY